MSKQKKTQKHSIKTTKIELKGETLTKAILESISDGVFTVNEDWQITSFNRAAERITGVKRKDAIGKSCCDIFRSSMCQTGCALRATLKSGHPIINRSGFIISAEGKRVPISLSTAVLYNETGEIIGGAETFRDLSEIEALRKELVGRYKIGDLISRSFTMRKVFDLIPAVASTFSTILIQGDTGTGKELVARAIQGSGSFAGKPFVAVNCGALPDSLLESELFGYKKGAFTGAFQDKPGLMTIARDGTLFLDEIGDISPAMQVKLLRVIQEKNFHPLGSTASENFKARIIAATNKNLLDLIKEGKFREDLFYRLNVIRIDLPPLRQRKEDIPLLVENFIEKFNFLYGRQIKGISNDALSALINYNWPGNIRELENFIERASIFCPGKTIHLSCFPDDFGDECRRPAESMKTARCSAEAALIQATLSRNKFNIGLSANELNIHRATLYRKIKKLRIKIPK